MKLASTRGTVFALRRFVRGEKQMWSWIYCYVIGHEYSVSCNDGAMFLRCISCGRRSNGWVVKDGAGAHAHGTRL
jgi:hypothetical protein